MIKIIKEEEYLLLHYWSDRDRNALWVDDKLRFEGEVTLRKTFNFLPADLLSSLDMIDDEVAERVFLLGRKEGRHYKVDRRILSIKNDLYLDAAMDISVKTFIAYRNISIFRKIDDLIEEPIKIGGEDEEFIIPIDDFYYLLKTFPTSTELDHYARSRISRLLKDHFQSISDAELKLQKYLERKFKKLDSIENYSPWKRQDFLNSYQTEKFEYVHGQLSSMLEDFESYKESDWQREVMRLMRLLFPKYVSVLENVYVHDFYKTPEKVRNRKVDFVLIDASGYIDIMEIKRPFSRAVLTSGTYRDNYLPRRELSGAIMQAEKYLYHLNKSGREGEKRIFQMKGNYLPPGLEPKISNPKAMILLGRDHDFGPEHKLDFEVIRRKYANMMDIITYDDLLRRVENIIAMMKQIGLQDWRKVEK